MDLLVFAMSSAIGIAITVAMVHFFGGSRVARIEDAEQARDRFATDYPNVEVLAVWPTLDRRSAMLETADGRVGLLHARGSKFLTRFFAPGDLASVQRSGPSGLSLATPDFTLPRAALEFESADIADRLAAALTARTPVR